MAAVGDRDHTGTVTLGTDELFGLGGHVHDEGVDHGDVVAPVPRTLLVGVLQVGPQLGEEADWSSALQVAVKVLLEPGLDEDNLVSKRSLTMMWVLLQSSIT